MYRTQPCSLFITESLDSFDESLSLTQHLQNTEDAQRLGEYDLLHEKVKEKIEKEKEVDLTEELKEDSEEPSEPEEDDQSSDEVKSDEDTIETPALESVDLITTVHGRVSHHSQVLRDEYYTQLATESFKDAVVDKVSSGVGYVASFALNLSKTLLELGVHYTKEAGLRFSAGVAYLFIRAVKSLMKGTLSATDAVKRNSRSFSKFKEEISTLRETIKTLKESELTQPEKKYTDQKVISWLTYGNKTSPVGSAMVMSSFMKTIIEHVNHGIDQDLNIVRKFIELSRSGVKVNPIKLLGVSPFRQRFLKKSVKGYIKDPDLVDSYVYEQSLPDRVLFIGLLPKSTLTELPEITKAYQESSLFLGVDPIDHITERSVDYMAIEEIEQFLDVLEKLCDQSLEHVSTYTRLLKENEKLKLGYRYYYQGLIESDEKKSLHQSLAEFVYLKQAFVNRVYLPAAIDVHDYVASYLVRALRFTSENVKALSFRAEI